MTSIDDTHPIRQRAPHQNALIERPSMGHTYTHPLKAAVEKLESVIKGDVGTGRKGGEKSDAPPPQCACA